MVINIPEKHLNELQQESINNLIRDAKGMHYATILMRINGEDRTFQVDWLKYASITRD